MSQPYFQSSFERKLIERAKKINEKNKIKILFIEKDARIDKAINIIKKHKIAEPILLTKGTIDERLAKAKNLLEKDKVDVVISGATHSSVLTLRMAFNFMAEKVKRVSGGFLMILPNDRILYFADCAVQPNPNAEQLAEIALLSANTFKNLTNEKPRIALLSYSTKGSGKGESPEKVKEAYEILCGLIKDKIERGEIEVDGEIQADAALDKTVAKFKGAKPLQYNVIIFPNLDAGNIGYKLVERLGKAKAIGPILQGLRKQVHDLSRGCSVEEIVLLAAISVIQTKNINI